MRYTSRRMASITSDEVRQTALLARLALTDDEVARLTLELSHLLGYIEQLTALDTAGVEPMTHAVPMDCPLRLDTPAPSLAADDALAAAPRRADDYFEVPKIIEAGS